MRLRKQPVLFATIVLAIVIAGGLVMGAKFGFTPINGYAALIAVAVVALAMMGLLTIILPDE